MSNQKNDFNVLVIGAGGIGCELLKNLVYSGFKRITIVDLDTIDVSNLNRQFLFRKCHVGKSKAEVAAESIKQFRPDVELIAHQASIFSSNFGPEFFEKFDIVFNALDNQAARRHVNRMCVNIGKAIIESGTSGYLGQVEPLLYIPYEKNTSKSPKSCCYECQPREKDKRTYPTCTIRNTPSEPVHCVVWAKFLFNQLFGEPDFEDEDISPDPNDPQAHSGDTNESPPDETANAPSASLWERVASIETKDFNVIEEALAWRLFNTDITKLLSMNSLWENRPERKPPTPLVREFISAATEHPGLDAESCGLRDQRKMDLSGWLSLFMSSCRTLRKRTGLSDDANSKYSPISWDKDDLEAMDFVTAASVIRAILFHVPGAADLTRFVVKSLAGNIIPAIATTNAVIAGAMVLQGLNVLHKRLDAVRTVFLHRQPAGTSGRFLAPCRPQPPNPQCLVCAGGPTRELRLLCHPTSLRLGQLRDEVLMRRLGMVAPEVEIDGKATILISSDEEETKDIEHKVLADFGLTGASAGAGVQRLRCDDFRHNMTLFLRVVALQPTAPTSNGDKNSHRDDITSWTLEGEWESPTDEAAGVNSAENPVHAVGSKRPLKEAGDIGDEIIVDGFADETGDMDVVVEPTRSKLRRLDAPEERGGGEEATQMATAEEIEDDDDLVILD